MKNALSRSLFSLVFFGAMTAILVGCGSSEPVSNAPADRVCDPISDTPTEAYKRLFAAVKDKDTAKIKNTMSSASQEFAESLGARQKKSIDEVYVNGFFSSTMASTLPEIRDERVSGCWAGVEVWSSKDQRWEDVPFTNENGEWRVAIGEMFQDTYRSPGRPLSQKERESANISQGSRPISNMMANAPTSNVNINTNTPAPYDGPQVMPLPKGK